MINQIRRFSGRPEIPIHVGRVKEGSHTNKLMHTQKQMAEWPILKMGAVNHIVVSPKGPWWRSRQRRLSSGPGSYLFLGHSGLPGRKVVNVNEVPRSPCLKQ